jgi:hypothetical protein
MIGSVKIKKLTHYLLAGHEPRSGARMQPTAQAVGSLFKTGKL